jgi:hypothetical protein
MTGETRKMPLIFTKFLSTSISFPISLQENAEFLLKEAWFFSTPLPNSTLAVQTKQPFLFLIDFTLLD